MLKSISREQIRLRERDFRYSTVLHLYEFFWRMYRNFSAKNLKLGKWRQHQILFGSSARKISATLKIVDFGLAKVRRDIALEMYKGEDYGFEVVLCLPCV